MRAEDWETIKRTFEAALKIPELNRESFVAIACENNPQIQATVLELLQSHRQAGSFMDDATHEGIFSPVFAEGMLVADRFRILRLLSRGGMGEVYEAYDEKLQLKIALKTVRP